VPTYDEVEQFALDFPETTSSPSYGGSPAFRVNKKLMFRLRTEMADEVDGLTGEAYGEVLVLRVADLGEKEALIADDSLAFFTTPHYDGYPAVLVRLSRVDPEELRELVTDVWLTLAPKRAIDRYVRRPAGGD